LDKYLKVELAQLLRVVGLVVERSTLDKDIKKAIITLASKAISAFEEAGS